MFKFALKRLKHNNFFFLQIEGLYKQRRWRWGHGELTVGNKMLRMYMIHPRKAFCLQRTRFFTLKTEESQRVITSLALPISRRNSYHHIHFLKAERKELPNYVTSNYQRRKYSILKTLIIEHWQKIQDKNQHIILAREKQGGRRRYQS